MATEASDTKVAAKAVITHEIEISDPALREFVSKIVSGEISPAVTITAVRVETIRFQWEEERTVDL